MKKDNLWKQLDPYGDCQKPIHPSAINGVNMLSKFLYAGGGPAQQSRMIKDKRRSFDRACLYSYQGAFIKKYLPKGMEQLNPVRVRALINPNKLKQDYDDKILSVGFEHGFETGDVFEWCQTGTYWLIYLQDLTELAYFRGEIRKCSYQINWIDEDGEEKSTYAAVRGPVETKIDYIQKHGVSVDNPNYSLNLLIPLTDEQIEKIVSRVRRLSFDNSKRGASSLEGIINRALHGSNDPEIESILSQQSKIYRAKQAEFRKSEEYEVAQEINKTHPDVMEKIMLAFDIAVCEEKEDGTVEMYCSCDESRLISSKHDNAVIKTKDGKTTIKVLEPDNSEKTLPDK